MKPISIVIADDHQLVRECFIQLFNSDERLHVVSTCGTAEEAIEAVKMHVPDILLLDINFPGISGIDAVASIVKSSPLSKVIGISMHTSPKYARRMMLEGASGYITKSSHKDEMIEAIIEVHEGKKFICQQTKELIAEQFTDVNSTVDVMQKLSRREIEVIDLIKKGLVSWQIAEALYISKKTVEVHRYNVLRKLNLKNTAALINFINKN